jgi:Coenzyme PQQ synthesis protein D (PqqD)
MEESIKLRSEDIQWKEVEGEIVILDLRSARYMAVNESGRFLWEAAAEGTTRTRLVKELMDKYHIDHPTAERDVEDFIETLRRNQLMATDDAATSPE